MRKGLLSGAFVGLAASVVLATAVYAATKASAPLVCSKGPAEQRFDVSVTVPESVATGSTFTIRLDGTPSAKISQVGLNFVHDMVTDYIVPTGTTYVEQSAKIVPDTGTENVRTGATVAHVGGLVRMTLPAHVQNGASYTPPSIELKAVAAAPAGDVLVVGFSQYRVTANAFVIGDLKVTCNPTPRPFPLATLRVTER